MVGWIAYMGRFLRVVGGRGGQVVRSAGPAAGPTSSLGVMGVLDLAADTALPVLDECLNDVRVLVHGCSFRIRRDPWATAGWMGMAAMARPGADR